MQVMSNEECYNDIHPKKTFYFAQSQKKTLSIRLYRFTCIMRASQLLSGALTAMKEVYWKCILSKSESFPALNKS